MKMDHHCPWISGCVGKYNYRYFFLFLFWTALGTLFMLTVVTPTFWGIMRRDPSVPLSFRTKYIFAFALSLAVTIALTLFMGWNLILTLSNTTTIEFVQSSNQESINKVRGQMGGHNVYDRGRKRNW
jgi:palmitoyltransferase